MTFLAILMRIDKSPNAKITEMRQYPEMFDFIINRACLTILIVRQAPYHIYSTNYLRTTGILPLREAIACGLASCACSLRLSINS